MKNNKYKGLVKDTAIFAMGSLGSKLIQFILMPLYTSYMSKEEFGISNLVFTIAQFLIPIFSIEIFDALVRFGFSKEERKEDVLKISIIVFFISGLLSIISLPILKLYEPIKEWRVYLNTYVLVNIFYLIAMNYLKVKEKNRTYAILSIVNTTILAVLNILLIAIIHTGVKGYLISNIGALSITAIVGAICGGVVTDFFEGKFSMKLFTKMSRYSLPLIFNTISWWLISSSDKIMVQAFIGAAALGIYSVAIKIPALINVIISIFQQSWGLSTIKEVENNNDTKFYSNVFRIYSLLVFGVSIAFILISRGFMKIYVGEEFAEASRFVPFLIVSAVFSAISAYFGSLYTALKKSTNIMLTTLVTGILNIIFNYIMIQKIEVMGAVVGTVIAYIFVANMRMVNIQKYLPLEIDYIKYIFNSILLIIVALIVTFELETIILSIIMIIIFVAINFNDCKMLVRRIRK